MWWVSAKVELPIEYPDRRTLSYIPYILFMCPYMLIKPILVKNEFERVDVEPISNFPYITTAQSALRKIVKLD